MALLQIYFYSVSYTNTTCTQSIIINKIDDCITTIHPILMLPVHNQS